MWFRTRNKESAPTKQAREGAQRAEAELAQVQSQRKVVEDLAGVLREAMRLNHFGEQIERSIALRRGR